MSAVTERDQQELIDRLAEVGGRLTSEEDVVFSGTKLVVPERMSMSDAVKFLNEKIAEDEKTVSYSREYKYRPMDGARATYYALKRAFGMVSQRSTFSFFGENPPQLVTLDMGPGLGTEQVPWGAVAVPLMRSVTLYLGHTRDPELGTIFQLSAEGPRKFRFQIEGIFRLVEDELANNSMYRGKAFDGQATPKFLDLRGFDSSKVIYSEEVLTQLDANVWAVLRHSDKLEALGMKLKRAVLLEGPYGCGKTLAASWTAQVAQQHGWTFINCRPSDNLFDVMQTARLYQPAVVFFEDVDTMANPDEARDDVSQLLDVFDGINAKDTRIVVVLTTNHKENIHKGMVRPGRLDAVIHIGELDAAGFEKLIKVSVPAANLGSVDYAQVAESMEGFLPAFAKEAIDRTMRYNVARNNGEVTKLDTADFVEAASGLRPQLDLMNGAKEKVEHDSIDGRLEQLVEKTVHSKVHGAVLIDNDGDEEYTVRANGRH